MKTTSNNIKEKYILVVGLPTLSSMENLTRTIGNKDANYKLALINDRKPKSELQQQVFELFDLTMICSFESPDSIRKALLPHQDKIIAATSFQETKIPLLQKVAPLLPYLKIPTSESLAWSIDKVEMRKRFQSYDKTMTPKFVVVKDTSEETLLKVQEKVGFPVVVKPSGLAGSRLVSICYHKEELEKELGKIFRKINKSYREFGDNKLPRVLVEQFMEGEMYTTDVYVDDKGEVTFCPMVHVKTGRSIGFDDFFGYRRITPTKLSTESVRGAHEVSTNAVHALGLRSSTGHIELLRTEDGWKIIEIGPRIGGFRDTMYKLSFDIEHTKNDVLNRIPKKINLPKKKLGYSSVLQFYAKKEGQIASLSGTMKAQKLKSFHSINIKKKVGDRAVFAKNGGKSVFDIVLFNKERSELLADIRRLEQSVKIKIK